MWLVHEQMREIFAERLHKIGAFKDVSHSPGGKGFRLALHEHQPDAPLSPYYLEIALVQSDLQAKQMAVKLLEQLMLVRGGWPELFAPVPQAIVPVISSLSDKMRVPMITPRGEQSHGSGARIDGIYKAGQSVLLFDDVISGGHSKRPAIQTLRQAGLVVNGVMVIVDRQQGGREWLASEGIPLHSVFTITELLDLYDRLGLVKDELYRQVVV